MSAKQYWWVTRPHRKLTSIPKSLQVFSSVASGEAWTKNSKKHIEYEAMLDSVQAKRGGDYVDRVKGRGGGGGRTHAALLYSLGLYFYHREHEGADQEVHLTLAGQAIVDQEDALPILRKQILNYQFSSAYSVGSRVNIDRRFKLRPFILMLKLLRRQDLGGYLTDEEIAVCVVCYAERHSDAEAEKVAERIKKYRASGRAGIPQDWHGMWASGKDVDALLASGGKARDVGNTFALWTRFTGYAQAVPGEEMGSPVKTVTAISESKIDEIDKAIEELDKPIANHEWLEPVGNYERERAAAAYQRGYGLPPGKVRDNRAIGAVRSASRKDKTLGLVSHALSHLYQTQIVTEVTPEIVEAVVNNTGLDERAARSSLEELIRSPQRGLSQFLDRYRQMATSGTEQAIDFEKATAEVLRTVFGLEAKHIGQTGKVPDVEVWNNEWLGIIDTKAYPSYQLESDHQLRMQTNYLPSYKGGRHGVPLKFFMYISGDFAPSFERNLRNVMNASGVSGSGMPMEPWLQLIVRYPESDLTHEDLRDLWSCGRKITAQDVSDRLGRRVDGQVSRV
ncbi:restriction endonuclease FokI C-terminal domain-containing protein [Kocuria palustris]|uniref:restriction endonuclease FokI C-terminal domain-containing protein n=1 Tax=Kocuria palustris TaxID=71999 RepID=UPI00242EF2F9|nr:restriction endonuclease FokI C-terminal domain-containing protein [Kocuria palustris]